MDLRDLDLIRRISKRKVNEGMVASRLSTRNIEAMNKGTYDKLMRRPFSNGRSTVK